MMPDIKKKEDDWDDNREITYLVTPAKQSLENAKVAHLRSIDNFIGDASRRGETSVEILPSQQFISDENKQILKDAGYKVIEKQTMAGNEVKISWE